MGLGEGVLKCSSPIQRVLGVLYEGEKLCLPCLEIVKAATPDVTAVATKEQKSTVMTCMLPTQRSRGNAISGQSGDGLYGQVEETGQAPIFNIAEVCGGWGRERGGNLPAFAELVDRATWLQILLDADP